MSEVETKSKREAAADSPAAVWSPEPTPREILPADMASIITSLNGSGLIRSKSALWGNAKKLKYKMKESPSPSFKCVS